MNSQTFSHKENIMGRLSGKVAFISGGARGQGAAEALLFAKEGAKVIIGDILDIEGEGIVEAINNKGGEARYVHLDVTSKDDWESSAQEIDKNFGQLHILVNNAGITLRRTVEETTVEEWDKVNEINSKGVFLGLKYSIPLMVRSGGGSIINISSIAGLIGMGNIAAYSASKGAVRLLTKSTAVQYGEKGIRCNSIHPGVIETDMTKESMSDELKRQSVLDATPLGSLGTVNDIAMAALYLASDESRYVTGTELVVDGGFTAK